MAILPLSVPNFRRPSGSTRTKRTTGTLPRAITTWSNPPSAIKAVWRSGCWGNNGNTARNDSQRAFGADEQLLEIKPGIVLEQIVHRRNHGAIRLEQNDEWAVQRSISMTAESYTTLSVNARGSLPEVTV
jgi:hypothetical protein